MFNYNIKKIIVILVITMIVSFSAAAIITIAAGGIHMTSMGMNQKNSQSYSVNEEKANKVNDIKEIYVENSFPNINVKVENTDEIKAHLYGNITSTFKPNLEAKVEGNKLIIKSLSESHFGFVNISGNLNLDITIPSSYNSNIEINSSSGKVTAMSALKLNNFKLHITSGDANLKDLTVEDLTVNSTSGVINGEKITSKKALIKSTSGDITFKNLTSDSLDISSSSGRINGDTINSKDTSLSSTSGDMKINAFKGNINQKTSSGKVLITYSEFNNNVKLSSTSGDITLNLPKDAQFKLNSKTTSGDINCNFPITIQEKSKRDNLLIGTVGSDKNSIEIEASSGDVNVTSK